MRYFEISGGFKCPVNREEQAVLDLMADGGFVANDDLDERKQEIARTMVTRGLLLRTKKDDRTVFTANIDPNDDWRL